MAGITPPSTVVPNMETTGFDDQQTHPTASNPLPSSSSKATTVVGDESPAMDAKGEDKVEAEKAEGGHASEGNEATILHGKKLMVGPQSRPHRSPLIAHLT